MLLTIDIGNSNITLGAYQNDSLLFVSRMYTARHKTSDEFATKLLEIFRLYHVKASEFTGTVISCVVPEIEGSIIRAVKLIAGKMADAVLEGKQGEQAEPVAEAK